MPARIFIRQTLAYFAWKWPYKPEVVKVDRPVSEIVEFTGLEEVDVLALKNV